MTLACSAHGIIVPLLRTAQDARDLVQSAKFPPAGQRGFGSLFSMEKFGGITPAQYLQQANDSLLTIVQIETKEALQNVRSLAFELWIKHMLNVHKARRYCTSTRDRCPFRRVEAYFSFIYP